MRQVEVILRAELANEIDLLLVEPRPLQVVPDRLMVRIRIVDRLEHGDHPIHRQERPGIDIGLQNFPDSAGVDRADGGVDQRSLEIRDANSRPVRRRDWSDAKPTRILPIQNRDSVVVEGCRIRGSSAATAKRTIDADLGQYSAAPLVALLIVEKNRLRDLFRKSVEEDRRIMTEIAGWPERLNDLKERHVFPDVSNGRPIRKVEPNGS